MKNLQVKWFNNWLQNSSHYNKAKYYQTWKIDKYKFLKYFNSEIVYKKLHKLTAFLFMSSYHFLTERENLSWTVSRSVVNFSNLLRFEEHALNLYSITHLKYILFKD